MEYRPCHFSSFVVAFVTDHTVHYNNVTAESFHTTKGEPQRSIFEPILFLVYMNIINASSKFQFIMYADDIMLLIGDRHQRTTSKSKHRTKLRQSLRRIQQAKT